MKIYKSTKRSNRYYIIGFILILIVTIALPEKFNNNWGALLGLIALFLIFNFLTYRLTEIRLDCSKNTLHLISHNYLGIKKASIYPLSEITFAYKRQATSPKSGIKNICTLFNSGTQLIQLVPDDDDWADEEIRRFVFELVEIGVKREFLGYNLKDVEV